MPADEIVFLLLKKADQDIYVLEKLLTDDAAPIEVFGFHAQQATEKLIKAMLAYRKIAYRRTHRLGDLVDLASDNGVAFPESVEFLVDLTPYAVEFRFDVAPEDNADDLDKQKVLDEVRALREWVTEQSKATADGDDADPADS